MKYREEMLRDVLEGYQEEYRELFDVWKSLEGKAQGIITVSGIFLAAMFAFIRTLSGPVENYEQWLLTVSVILLVFSVISALCAQRLRDIYKPPYGSKLDDIVKDLSGNGKTEIQPDMFDNYLIEQYVFWKKINSDIYLSNKEKAKSLRFAQILLVLSILCFVVYTFIKIWSN